MTPDFFRSLEVRQMREGVFLGGTSSFLSELSYADLQKLRAHIKAKHMNGWPEHAKTDREADKMIEAHGPRVKQKLIQAKINAGVHP
jgi:predicted transposase YbfD/YdcC